MSAISTRLETLAETHCVNPLHILEWYLERLAIMQADNVPNAEQLALEDVEFELNFATKGTDSEHPQRLG